MDQKSESSIPPEYRQIIEEIGKQLNQRKSTLLKRVALITWPFLLLIIWIYLFTHLVNVSSFSEGSRFIFGLIYVCYVILAAIYVLTVRFVFSIEKLIWIDSFFDNKNLSPRESWRISMKLFWPSLIFHLKIFFRYYLLPGLISVMYFLVYISLITTTADNNNGITYSQVGIWIGGFLILIIALIVYAYYIQTKLRYVQFVFIDNYGDYTFSEMLREMNQLDSISKSETFKKSLVLTLGTHSVNAISRSIISILGTIVSQFGEVGGVLGNVTKVYGDELSRQVTEYGNIVAQYTLYRFARKEAFGSEQKVNDRIYNLNN